MFNRLITSASASRQLALAPLTGIINACLNLLAVVIASRDGQLASIAGFAVGASAVAVVAVFASGGTTLVYINGTSAERQSVRRFRHLVTSPALLLAAVAVGLAYESFSSVSLLAVVAGGLSVMFNNAVELLSAEVQRHERIAAWAGAIVASRLAAILLLLFNLDYAFAMLAAAGVLIIGAWIITRGLPREAEQGQALFRSVYSVRLLALSVSNVLIVRAPFLVLPFVASADEAGAITVLLTGQQAASAVFTSGLYAIMAAKSRGDASSATRLRDMEGLFLALAFLGAAAACALEAVFLDLLSISGRGTTAWFYLSVLAIPFVCLNRSWQYRLLGQRLDGKAQTLVTVVMVASVGTAAVGAIGGFVTLLVASVLVGELVGMAYGFATMREDLRRQEVPT